MNKQFNGIYKGKRVLVTGHTGFKGSWLSIWLKELGADVIGYSLKPPSDPSNFEVCNLESRITHIHGDVRNLGQLLEVFKKYKPEIVFHLAAQPLVRYSYIDPHTTYDTNVMGTVNVLETVRQTKSVRVVVIITSDKCYENKEWVWGYRESDSMGGNDPYSSSKGCAELVTNAYRQSFFNTERYEEHHVAISSVRAGNVIGGGDWGEDRLIPDCVRALSDEKPVLIRNPKAIRPWQHVLDPLGGYLLLGAGLWTDGPRYACAWNFGPSDMEVLTVEEVVKKFLQYWGKGDFTHSSSRNLSGPATVLHEANRLKLDCSKARSLLKWTPVYGIDHALKKTVEWYKLYYSGASKDKIYEENTLQIAKYMEELLARRLQGSAV